MRAKLIVSLVLAVLVLIILVQNARAVTFHLLFWKLEISLFLLIFFVTLIGFTIGYVASEVFRGRRNQRGVS